MCKLWYTAIQKYNLINSDVKYIYNDTRNISISNTISNTVNAVFYGFLFIKKSWQNARFTQKY